MANAKPAPIEITKREMWSQLDKNTKDFITAMIKNGMSIRVIRNKNRAWIK